MGTVTEDRPEAQSTGAVTARLMLWAAARVGAAFSIRPRFPALNGLGTGAPFGLDDVGTGGHQVRGQLLLLIEGQHMGNGHAQHHLGQQLTGCGG